jgi:hypothetical protein
MGHRRDDGFVLADGLTIDQGARLYLMSGRVDCAGGISVDVRKVLRVVSGAGATAMVQTADYTYHVVVGGLGNLFRYCSPHDDADHPEHKPFHHKHVYDLLHGDVVGTIETIADDEWPTLGEVLEEARDWHLSHVEEVERLLGH